MARIIEYDERDYGESRGFGGGSIAAGIILLLLVLYLSGYLPWFSNTPASIRTGVATTPPVNIPVNNGQIGTLGGVNYVVADNLNMRQGPGNYSQVTYILPRGTQVTPLGESYREVDGDLWIQVRISTNEGPQIGWVNRRYIS